MTDDKLQKYAKKHKLTPFELQAYAEVQKRYKENRIKKRKDNLARGLTTFVGNQHITEELDKVTYTVTSNMDQVSYVAVGGGLFAQRILKQPQQVTEYILDPLTRKWVEVIITPEDNPDAL